jgi:hypothetical protein
MRAIIFFAGLVPLAIFLANCGPEPVAVPEPIPVPPTGGTGTGSGGTGTSGSVGTSGSQGISGSQGAGGVGTGGTVGKGGTGPAGGTTSGTSSTAGTTATAGASSAGTSSVAGTTGTSGATGTAGTGPVVDCGAAFSIGMDGFVRAPAAAGACWHGYASAGGDTGSTIMPTMFATCGAGCMLASSGTVGPATEENSYAGTIYIGFNVGQAAGASTKGTVTPTGSGLTFTFTAPGITTVRAQISSGSAATTRWCATATSGTLIPYAMFNTACWEPTSGTAYAKQPIDTVQMVIPGTAEEQPFEITITSVKET